MARIQQKNRAVFLDRDGTIARDVPYCSRPEDFEMFAGVPEAIRALNEHGFKVVVITNQSGVGRGYFSEEMLQRIHAKMLIDLEQAGARIDGIYYCPHHPDENCDCRKPKTALFRRAGQEMEIDFQSSYMIGDMAQDIEAGRAVGCRTVFVTNRGKPLELSQKGKADYEVETFSEAVKWILGENGGVLP